MACTHPHTMPPSHLSEWFSQQQRFFTCTFCTTLRPLPMGGACVNTMMGTPLLAASTDSNHAICSSSMYTSCTLQARAGAAVQATQPPSWAQTPAHSRCGLHWLGPCCGILAVVLGCAGSNTTGGSQLSPADINCVLLNRGCRVRKQAGRKQPTSLNTSPAAAPSTPQEFYHTWPSPLTTSLAASNHAYLLASRCLPAPPTCEHCS